MKDHYLQNQVLKADQSTALHTLPITLQVTFLNQTISS